MSNVVDFKKPKGSWQRKWYEHGYRAGRAVAKQDMPVPESRESKFIWQFIAFIAGVSVGAIGIAVLFTATL